MATEATSPAPRVPLSPNSMAARYSAAIERPSPVINDVRQASSDIGCRFERLLEVLLSIDVDLAKMAEEGDCRKTAIEAIEYRVEAIWEDFTFLKDDVFALSETIYNKVPA